ncbi:hypothetical protein Pelo_17354 [Pelomyxa schiedti]|nr:hypothetical protein Pelo_17354 [Pelomyxa schiedti]
MVMVTDGRTAVERYVSLSPSFSPAARFGGGVEALCFDLQRSMISKLATLDHWERSFVGIVISHPMLRLLARRGLAIQYGVETIVTLDGLGDKPRDVFASWGTRLIILTNKIDVIREICYWEGCLLKNALSGAIEDLSKSGKHKKSDADEKDEIEVPVVTPLKPQKPIGKLDPYDGITDPRELVGISIDIPKGPQTF